MQEQTPLAQDTDIGEAVADPEVLEYLEKLKQHRQETIEREANRRIKKNKREIKRLHKHAQECLINDNKDGYIYAIGKLRKLTGHVVGDDVLETLWQTSREQVQKIAASFAEAQANLPEGQNFSQ
ncbi:hypothetical protein VPHD480_0104 [Vibrio phage D480]|nr:hypothetical protein MYOV011v1_p0104 [Vibrio phage 6E35.1a]